MINNVYANQSNLDFVPGSQTEAYGRPAAVGGVGPGHETADLRANSPVGGEPGAVALRAVSTQVLHGQSAKWGVTQPKGTLLATILYL